MDNMEMKKSRRTNVILFLLVFFVFFVFFTILHPIVLSDSDDWLFTFFHRDATPSISARNPCRILPETFIPLVSQLSVWLLYPLIGNCFVALTIGHAAAVSVSIAVLALAVFHYLKHKLDATWRTGLIYVAVFFLCHFWIFAVKGAENRHMFSTVDACTHFFYVIPNVLNCSAVLWVLCDEKLLSLPRNGEYAKKGLFILFAYFCIFSNIWASILLAVAVFWKTVFAWFVQRRNGQFRIKPFLSEYGTGIGILVLWFAAQLMEMNGGRASIGDNNSVIHNFLPCAGNLLSVAAGMRRSFVLFAGVAILVCLFIIIREKDKKNRISILYWLLTAFLVTLYLILSCAKVGPGYIYRQDVFYVLFFCGMMILLTCFAAIFRRFPVCKAILPLLVVIMFFEINTESKTFSDSCSGMKEPAQAYAVDQYILDQFLEAQENKLDSITLVLPNYGSSKNWPHMPVAASNYSRALYKLGIVDYFISVDEAILSDEASRELGLSG